MKKLIISLVVLMMSAACFATDTAQKKILFMVAEGFYAPEYFKPLRAFNMAGYKVTTATKYSVAVRPDKRQWDTHPAVQGNIIFKDILVKDYDAIVFAGGNGAWEDFFPNADVHKALADFMNNDKLVALLCSSTGLLGVANNFSGKEEPIAKGRKVTGYKRVESLLVNLGQVEYLKGEKGKPFVVTDGNLITGRDPISSELFAKTIIEKLSNK
jgi:protease I